MQPVRNDDTTNDDGDDDDDDDDDDDADDVNDDPNTIIISSPSPQATASMCYYCFEVLFYELYQKYQQQHQQQQQTSTTLFGVFTSLSSTTTAAAAATAATMNSTDDTTSSFILPTKPKMLDMSIDQYVHQCNNNNNTTSPTTTTLSNIECPLFVTWEKRKKQSIISIKKKKQEQNYHTTTTTTKNEYELRGCIGSLSSKRLQDHLYYYIIHSAFQDVRFTPITINDVFDISTTTTNNHNNSITVPTMNIIPLLRVSVSLLVQYEICNHCYDWTIGVHGIIIQFTTESTTTYNSKKSYSATFLPEVATEQQWDIPTTIQQLIRKAGYTNGTINQTLLDSIQCTRYQSSKYYMTLDEYIHLYNKRHLHDNNNNNDTNINTNTDNTNDVSIQHNEQMEQQLQPHKICNHPIIRELLQDHYQLNKIISDLDNNSSVIDTMLGIHTSSTTTTTTTRNRSATTKIIDVDNGNMNDGNHYHLNNNRKNCHIM